MKSFITVILIAAVLPVSAQDYSCTPNGAGGLDCRERSSDLLDGYRIGSDTLYDRSQRRRAKQQEIELRELQRQILQQELEQKQMENERRRLAHQGGLTPLPYRAKGKGSRPSSKSNEMMGVDMVRCSADGDNARVVNDEIRMNSAFIRCMHSMGYNFSYELL